jgi:hypothetical protein
MPRLRSALSLLTLLFLLMGAIMVLPVIEPAAAATNLVTVVTATRTLPRRQGASVTLPCPSGTRIVGVGFAGVVRPLHLWETYLRGPNDGNLAGVFVDNVDGNDPHTFTGYGLCLAKSASDTTVVKRSHQISGGNASRLTAGCPTGSKLLAGGGGAYKGYSPTTVTASKPTDDRWTIAVNNRESAVHVTLRHYVSCAFAPALRIQTVTVGGIPAPPGVTAKSVPCPTGMSVAGGGYSVPIFGPFEDPGNLLAVQVSRPVITTDRQSWRVHVGNNTSVTTSFSAYAVCVALT